MGSESSFEKSYKYFFLILIIVLSVYPIVFAVSRDLNMQTPTLVISILGISVLYGFLGYYYSARFIHGILLGVLVGYSVGVLSWLLAFREEVFHFSDNDMLSSFYSCGVFLPIAVRFFSLVKKNNIHFTVFHRLSTRLIIFVLLFFILYSAMGKVKYESFSLIAFHFILGAIVGILTMIVVHYITSRNLLMFDRLTKYLAVMVKPILAFFLGYLFIMFLFTGLYTLTYTTNPTVFSHLKNDKFGDMMFYSFSVITGLGFSVIQPEKPIALFLTTCENFMGLIWMSVVFSAALAYLQAPFARITSQLDKLLDENIEKKVKSQPVEE